MLDEVVLNIGREDLGGYYVALVRVDERPALAPVLTIRVAKDLEASSEPAIVAWLTQRVAAYQEIGPERDGWYQDPDGGGGWYLWCRLVEMDPVLA